MFLNCTRTSALRIAGPASQLRALSFTAARRSEGRIPKFPYPNVLHGLANKPHPVLADAVPSSSAIPTPAAPVRSAPLPYFINRTSSNKLPVYADRKRGGNLLLTTIRKTEGNLTALREDLINALKLDPERIYINNLTKHVIIKGHVKPQVERFLTESQF